jgi:LysM repeat protein
MASRTRGRHRRPSPAKKVIRSAAAGGGIAAAGMIMTATGAQAQPVPHDSLATFLPVAAKHVTTTTAVTTVTVRRGNSLSEIAEDHCGTPQDWTGIYDANDKVIGRDPNLIVAGQQLTLSCKTGWAPKPPVVPESPQRAYSAPKGYSRVVTSDVSTAGMGGFQSCVISRESGGNPQITNASDHWGLYQFSAGTWAAHGGNPADFGRVGAAEQTQVFWNTVHEDGTSDWAPYDGC